MSDGVDQAHRALGKVAGGEQLLVGGADGAAALQPAVVADQLTAERVVDPTRIRELAGRQDDVVGRPDAFAAGNGDRPPPAAGIGLAQRGAHEADAADVPGGVALVARRREHFLQRDAFALQFFQLAGRHEHLVAGTPVADGHRAAGQPLGRAGAVHGREPPANHDRRAGERGRAAVR